MRHPGGEFQGAWYAAWTVNRIYVIQNYYGEAWFHGKRILEVGCGVSGIGAHFAALGAQVTVTDARKEYVDETMRLYPAVHEGRVLNVETLSWGWEKDAFDLVLNLGVVYHVREPIPVIHKTALHAPCFVLETECRNRKGRAVDSVAEKGFDQSVSGQGNRPTPEFVTRVLANAGIEFVEVRKGLSTTHHKYDWEPGSAHGRGFPRRLWFCRRKEQQQ